MLRALSWVHSTKLIQVQRYNINTAEVTYRCVNLPAYTKCLNTSDGKYLLLFPFMQLSHLLIPFYVVPYLTTFLLIALFYFRPLVVDWLTD